MVMLKQRVVAIAMPHYLEVETPDGGENMAELREAMETVCVVLMRSVELATTL
ncbi:hypothetical protein JG688_00005854 [Phytophthora aleatoria]|uniref:Uncharacterized protein n=1 Tax=Phytophthora aleatoria TaxID=2496075 RepID=A0A8J5IZ90_9STRA|nr:hypothetical protein JG688_00005854 [Phytophthora aleatoria]